MNPHEKALNGIFDDMDDFETKKMFGEPKSEGSGFSVTISVTPDGASESVPEESAMNEGGEVFMSEGGMIGEPERGETDDISLPPFLRKKKKSV